MILYLFCSFCSFFFPLYFSPSSPLYFFLSRCLAEGCVEQMKGRVLMVRDGMDGPIGKNGVHGVGGAFSTPNDSHVDWQDVAAEACWYVYFFF